MDEPRAQRTLVKSPPELWAEISDPGALAGHLGEFGDIRITRLEPESTVAWEGDRARGTVELEPSGWGTKVTLTARIDDAPAPGSPAPAAVPEPERADPEARGDEPTATADRIHEPTATADRGDEPPATANGDDERADPEPAQARRGLLARLFGRRRRPAEAATAPADDRAPAEPTAPVDERAPDEPIAPTRTREPKEPAAPADPPAPAAAATGPEPAPPVAHQPAPLDAGRAEEILVGVLDDLGAARHRPFSRG
jgi:hypothetical protein